MPAESAEKRLLGRASTFVVLTLVAVLAHALTLFAIHHQRGHITAYAFQSPDAAEYVNLARGLAWQHRYIQLDEAGNVLTGPDTWRTPGYPLFLALIIRIASDSPATLLGAQQIIGVACVPLLWLVLRRLTSPRWAMAGALLWCFDPYRLYYSLWLLSEALFTFVLIVGCYYWLWFREAGCVRQAQSRTRLAVKLGLLSGLLVLIRPIALPLPIIALVGVFVVSVFDSRRGVALTQWNRKWVVAIGCLVGILIPLAPWIIRVHSLTGHFAISQQSGASLAYHKVVDVVLWSQGRERFRFDPTVAAEIRDQIDVRMQHEWLERFGHLSPEEADSLRWQNLNFGKPLAPNVDPIVASGMLWSIGTDMLRGRLGFMVKCFAVQGVMMLIFPLGLVLWPPASSGSAPLSMFMGGQGGLGQMIAVGIGMGYAILIGWILVRMIVAMIKRRLPVSFFAFWPALAMFVFSLPFEDPRFRLPLVPLFWILALGQCVPLNEMTRRVS